MAAAAALREESLVVRGGANRCGRVAREEKTRAASPAPTAPVSAVGGDKRTGRSSRLTRARSATASVAAATKWR